MKPFIHDDFLLRSAAARRLYHEHAARQPIIDYHCHLPPADIAANRRFSNLAEIWLEGDHYKWRAMRCNGVEEVYCTGNADPYEKYLAWASTAPKTLRNPLYHWTQLELKRYFGIDALLNGESAREIWEETQRQMREPWFCAHGILHRFRVEAVGTTDDPADSLEHHRAIAASNLSCRVAPAFRPDQALAIGSGEDFVRYADRLGAAAGVNTRSYEGFCEALEARHQYFHEQGTRLSDHGLNRCPANFAKDRVVAAIYEKARSGVPVTVEESEQFASAVMLLCGRLDAEKGWVKQLHLGAMRNLNSRRLAELGRDTGFDSIGDQPQGEALAKYLDRLESEGRLPKMVLYNVNPRDNYLLAAMTGSFQEAGTPGKIQFGSGWWFLDQKEGIEQQLNALSNNGLLSRFVGMLTDSRSFLSYPRHEYFRRILCELLGGEMESGLLPNDYGLVGGMVEDICYGNAKAYFSFPAPGSA